MKERTSKIVNMLSLVACAIYAVIYWSFLIILTIGLSYKLIMNDGDFATNIAMLLFVLFFDFVSIKDVIQNVKDGK